MDQLSDLEIKGTTDHDERAQLIATAAICNGWVTCKYKVSKASPLQIAKRWQ